MTYTFQRSLTFLLTMNLWMWEDEKLFQSPKGEETMVTWTSVVVEGAWREVS